MGKQRTEADTSRQTGYKYEVAFSFLKEDEALAVQLNELLRDRYPTFIYSEHQTELAGKDGEVFLKQVFGKEARIVVILYRRDWGTKGWTRIEDNAIRDRAYDDGYDFCLLIPMNDPATIPRWFPKNRIWINTTRYGLETTAAIIEYRLQEQGGEAHSETTEEKVMRLRKQVAQAQETKAFLCSDKAVAPADHESQELLARIEALSKQSHSKEIPIGCSRDSSGIKIRSLKYKVTANWQRSYSNSLSGSGLTIRLGRLDETIRYDENFTTIREVHFDFHMDEIQRFGWRSRHAERKFYTSEELADWIVELLIKEVTRYRLEELKNPLES